MSITISLVAAMMAAAGSTAVGPALKPGDPAPLFTAKLHDGSTFDLASRKGKGWTVLYFYPKADTPGCTKQACAFRDAIDGIRKLGAEVYGVSADKVASQAKFHEKYHLTFPLVADPDAEVIEKYGVKRPALKVAKRWTFLIDPNLEVRRIDPDVDPALDAEKVAAALRELQVGK